MRTAHPYGMESYMYFAALPEAEKTLARKKAFTSAKMRYLARAAGPRRVDFVVSV